MHEYADYLNSRVFCFCGCFFYLPWMSFSIRGRSDARKAAQGTKNQAANTSKQAEKLGYVPRNKATPLKESGLTSGGMIGRNKVCILLYKN